jgi:hypothetical protein
VEELSWLSRKCLVGDIGRLNRSRTSLTVLEDLPKLTFEETQCQSKLISFIVGDDIVKGSLAAACSWYSRHLQMKFQQTWHALAPSLLGLEDETTAPRPGDLVIVYNFVLAVAELLSTRQHIAMVEIVDELDNNHLLKPQLDEERAKPNQIVFAAVGWLTMFYEAVPNPEPDKLEVKKTSTTSSGKRHALITRKYCSFRQSFDDIDLPLYSMLGRFGCLIPVPRTHPLRPQGFSGDQHSEVIMIQSVCFNTLQQIAGLKIEWVSSLALHLELDSGRKTLKLFQYPSFCRMMMIDKKTHLLSRCVNSSNPQSKIIDPDIFRLLNDHAENYCEDVNPADIRADEFFEEILRSYRLIFGQDERSYKAFSKMLTKLEEDQGQGMSIGACDPLLRVLCGQSSMSNEAKYIYEEIDANQQTTYCNPDTEFPFFGKRLMELQQFEKQHQPQNVKTLLSDRRDVAAWFTLWNNQLLVYFATFTIFIMLVSLGFQIWQTILTKQQLQQGTGT